MPLRSTGCEQRHAHHYLPHRARTAVYLLVTLLAPERWAAPSRRPALLAANKVVTHRQVLTQIWGPAHQDDVQYLRVVVAQLRAKLEAEPKSPMHLLSEAGVGYRLVE